MYKRILVSALSATALFAHCQTSAAAPPPTGDVRLDIQAIYDQVAGFEAYMNACITQAPRLSPLVEQAHSVWLQRNASFLSEVEALWSEYIRKQPGITPERIATMRQLPMIVAKTAAAVLSERIQALPPQSVDQVCKAYPDLTQGSKGNLSDIYANHLDEIRSAVKGQ